MSASGDAARFALAAGGGEAARVAAGASGAASASACSVSRTKRGAPGAPHCSSSAAPGASAQLSPGRSGVRFQHGASATKTGDLPTHLQEAPTSPRQTSSSSLLMVRASASSSAWKKAKRPRRSGGAAAEGGRGSVAPRGSLLGAPSSSRARRSRACADAMARQKAAHGRRTAATGGQTRRAQPVRSVGPASRHGAHRAPPSAAGARPAASARRFSLASRSPPVQPPCDGRGRSLRHARRAAGVPSGSLRPAQRGSRRGARRGAASRRAACAVRRRHRSGWQPGSRLSVRLYGACLVAARPATRCTAAAAAARRGGASRAPYAVAWR